MSIIPTMMPRIYFVQGCCRSFVLYGKSHKFEMAFNIIIIFGDLSNHTSSLLSVCFLCLIIIFIYVENHIELVYM